MDTSVRAVTQTDLLTARCLVAAAIATDNLKWRHHGAGMIQAYLTPRLRIHIWHPTLVLPGMEHSGAIHDHRFDLMSTVLLGSLTNRELDFHPSSQPWNQRDCRMDSLYEVYTVECASSGKRDDPVKLSDKARPLFYKDVFIPEGSRYFFPKKAFHQSIPISEGLALDEGYVVTLVHKLNQEDFLARLLVPEGVQPVHAFKEATGSQRHTVVPPADAEAVREFYNRRLTPVRMQMIADFAHALLMDKIEPSTSNESALPPASLTL